MNKSHLLINEQALQVLPSLALAVGLEESIVLQQLHYWLNNPKNEGRVDENGNKWVYNTYSQWREDNFPFWTDEQIKRYFLSLEKQGVVIAEQLDAKRRDMRKFYRIDYEFLHEIEQSVKPKNQSPIMQNSTMQQVESAPSIDSNSHDVKMNQRLPENTTLRAEKKPDLMDAILDQERSAQAAKNSGKAWMHRTKFSFNEHVLALADKAVQIFGEPSKKDVTLWVMEIGSWVDAGARGEDWKRAREIVSGYSQPVVSITGMTKAVKFAAQERKNGGAEEKREPYHPEYEKVVFDPEEEKKYVPNPNPRRFQS